jgi:hypothetical protein
MATVEGMTALQAAMILDLRIHPATLAAYASTLRA